MVPWLILAYCTEFWPEFLSNIAAVLAPSMLFRHWMLGHLVHAPSSPWCPSVCVKESTPGAPGWGNKADTYGTGRSELYSPSSLQGSDATLLNRDFSSNHDLITFSAFYSTFLPLYPPRWTTHCCVTLSCGAWLSSFNAPMTILAFMSHGW